MSEIVNENFIGNPLDDSYFHCFWIKLQFGMLVFVEKGKPEYQEKNSWSKDENQQQLRDSNPSHIGWKQLLLPWHHLCSPNK